MTRGEIRKGGPSRAESDPEAALLKNPGEIKTVVLREKPHPLGNPAPKKGVKEDEKKIGLIQSFIGAVERNGLWKGKDFEERKKQKVSQVSGGGHGGKRGGNWERNRERLIHYTGLRRESKELKNGSTEGYRAQEK